MGRHGPRMVGRLMMCLVVLAVGLTGATGQMVIAVSDFDNQDDMDGWGHEGDPRSTFSWVGTSGAGYVRMHDAASVGLHEWYVAPPKFLGDWTSARRISFHYRLVSPSAYRANDGPVIYVYNGTSYAWWRGFKLPDNGWHAYSADLGPTASGWTLPSGVTWNDHFRNVTAVHIEGELVGNCADTSALDNVVLEGLPVQLSWLGTTGFLTDGVDPNKGAANSTLFAFKVKLTDEDADEPDYVRVILDKDGVEWKAIDLVARPGSTQDGRVYGIKRKLPRGNWTYRFVAEDGDGMAEGEPTLPRPGPKMTSPPYLVWAQEPGYGDGDGVEPNSGYDMVDREFKVVYRDHGGDLPRYVKVALWRDGGWYGMFAMKPPPPPLDPAAGLLYTLSKKLEVGTYEYRFRAADRHGTAGGPASVKVGGLEVIAAVPILSWTGEDGYKTDGVAPNKGLPDNTMFRFRVKLTDPDNDEPEHVRLILRKDGVPWRTINMRAEAGPTMSGRMYAASTKLPVGNYAYRVAARDEDGRAEGDPAYIRPGPIMPAPPFLLFSSDPGYENKDGVKPNTGQANDTVFRFKCIYKSHDGDAPAWVRVRLWRNGAFHKVYQLAARGSTKDPVVGGIVYGAARRLPAGAYAYRFEGQDWKGEKAIGPGTAKLSGLTVNSGGATAIASLSAAPTNAGTQITLTLASSAEVTARILNIAGRPIKTLCHARTCEAGANTLLWNAQSDTGLSVPNGMYLVEVNAKAGDGTQARAVGQVRIAR